VSEFEEMHSAIGHAGATMEANERQHRELVEAGAAALWSSGPDMGLRDSRGWEMLTGLPPGALRGNGWLDSRHPDDVAPTIMAWAQAASTKGAIHIEYCIQMRDGTWQWHRACGVRSSTMPATSSNGSGSWRTSTTRKKRRRTSSRARPGHAPWSTAPDAINVLDERSVVHS